MFFWILLFSPLILGVAFAIYFTVMEGWASAMPSFLAGFIICLTTMLISIFEWSEYSKTYSKVAAQSEVIAVYEERVASLKATLNEINYPQKSDINLDADTPWASLIASLAEAERELALAKKVRAEALRDIEAWKRGPMSGVVGFVGEPVVPND